MGKGFNHLLGCPGRRRMVGHVYVNYPPAVMPQHDEDEQNAASDRRDREEVNRHQRGDVIRQKRAPRLGRRPPWSS